VIPNYISDDCQNLLAAFLKRNPFERIGASAINGSEELKNHNWFKDVDWDYIYNKISYPKKIKAKKFINK
jgi:hypothetical protein